MGKEALGAGFTLDQGVVTSATYHVVELVCLLLLLSVFVHHFRQLLLLDQCVGFVLDVDLGQFLVEHTVHEHLLLFAREGLFDEEVGVMHLHAHDVQFARDEYGLGHCVLRGQDGLHEVAREGELVVLLEQGQFRGRVQGSQLRIEGQEGG